MLVKHEEYIFSRDEDGTCALWNKDQDIVLENNDGEKVWEDKNYNEPVADGNEHVSKYLRTDKLFGIKKGRKKNIKVTIEYGVM